MPIERETITTARLVLRPFGSGDVEDVLAYGSDPEVAFYSTNAPPMDKERARQAVERAVATPWEDRQRFAITFEGRVIGAIELEPEWANALANLGYEIGRLYWGRGFATEAASAVLAYGFETLGLAKIYGRADPRNEASWRVLEKI